METYNDLKKNWKKEQRNLPDSENEARVIEEKIFQMQKKQRLTNIILGATVTIIIGYLLYVLKFGINELNVGLLLMSSVLMIRICIEVFDKKRLSNLNAMLAVDDFTNQLWRYYRHRAMLHKIITPVLFLLYIFGFTLLLPTFKAVFSKGFYIYILVSGFISLAVIAIIIIKQTRKELQELKSLQ